jgi:hypothetical protein
MSTLAMILAAMIVPGNGPEKVSGEVSERELRALDLHSEWRGAMYSPPDTIESVAIKGGHLLFLARGRDVGHLFVCTEKSEGTFRVRWSDETCLGIYRYEEGRLLLCLSEAGNDRPTSFKIGDGQYLLILHRVKPLR